MKNIFTKAIILSLMVSLISTSTISPVSAKTSQPPFEAPEAEPLSNQNEQTINVEREYIPPTPEAIAETKNEGEDFDCNTVTDVPVSECEVIVKLYKAFRGPDWGVGGIPITRVGDLYGVEVEDIGFRVKELRNLSDISINQIAAYLGIDENEYLNYESGEKDIPVGVLYEISQILKVDMGLLVFR